ncbi:homeotic protein spalt-major [Hyalella azteca]|uniref:Homeotic protein spalt-major n=1 Tax=Hyalella azteca TaxID=294128 RepID=A0A8B7N0V0_HYAAZ|nr:homeotic protein spalt-major [Hyalella azteca]
MEVEEEDIFTKEPKDGNAHAHEDAVNNNSNDIKLKIDQSSDHNDSTDGEEPYGLERDSLHNSFLARSNQSILAPELSLNEQLANSSLTLEAINNTRMTLAKLASAAAQSGPGESSLPDVTLLQRALYNLQHQQVIQMQLIKQLQEQLSSKNKADEREKIQGHGKRAISPNILESRQGPISIMNNFTDRLKSPNSDSDNTNQGGNTKVRELSPPLCGGESITSSVIQHNDSPPSTSEPNTLEMLQRTANQVLSNASQGLLTNRLIDDYSKNGDVNDGTNKHRCRYCGKIFGSDSALQIHLRSHTGERPFKCNICGNRFTTKGNLKVHFQRHQARFPHVKMNPHPIPENLDKFYPPLLAQLGEISDCPPAPTGPPSPFSPGAQSSTIPGCPPELSPSLPPTLDFSIGMTNPLLPALKISQEKSDLLNECKDTIKSQSEVYENMKTESPFFSKNCSDADDSMDSSVTRSDNEKRKFDQRFMNEDSDEQLSFSSGRQRDDIDDSDTKEHLLSKCPTEKESESNKPIMKRENMDVDSHVGNIPSLQPEIRPKLETLHNIPNFPFPGLRFPFPLNFPFLPGFNAPMFQTSLPPPQPRPVIPPGVDPAKDPNVYNSLLPRPGSTDSSWEALIEVKKTSETMKLEELVKNIEYKLEPNQCVICHRVLSCKSALQMHYRTHTGERPFKCKICNHTFTTKGNLKTHMSVHRARPHVGMLHQCPVCHKKFGNSLVLQQHIRLHTGEPTDLSPEQISAAEVRDMSPNFQSFPPNLLPPGVPLPPHHPLRGFAPFQFPMRYPISPDFLRTKDRIRMEDKGEEDEAYIRFKSEMMALDRDREQRVAEDLSTKIRDENLQNGSASPRRSISPSPSDYSDPGMRETTSENSSYSSDRNAGAATSPAVGNESPAPLNLVSRPHHPPFWSPIGLFPQTMPSSAQITSSPSTMSPVFSPLYLPNIPGRGNTTCKICFKTLACQSALEIHYRSHTKERPFKCLYCDRGFTTRGNMKQHLLTHKVRNGDKKNDTDPASPAGSEANHSSQSFVPSSSSSPSSRFPSPPVTSTVSPVTRQTYFSNEAHHSHLNSHSRKDHTNSRASPSPRQPMFSPPQQTSFPTSPSRPLYQGLNYEFPPASTETARVENFSPKMQTDSCNSEDNLRGSECERVDFSNLKRGRDGELVLPESKRAQSTEAAARPLDLHQARLDSGNLTALQHTSTSLPSPPATLPLQVS